MFYVMEKINSPNNKSLKFDSKIFDKKFCMVPNLDKIFKLNLIENLNFENGNILKILLWKIKNFGKHSLILLLQLRFRTKILLENIFYNESGQIKIYLEYELNSNILKL